MEIIQRELNFPYMHTKLNVNEKMINMKINSQVIWNVSKLFITSPFSYNLWYKIINICDKRYMPNMHAIHSKGATNTPINFYFHKIITHIFTQPHVLIIIFRFFDISKCIIISISINYQLNYTIINSVIPLSVKNKYK